MFGNACACRRKVPGSDTTYAEMAATKAPERERPNLMMNITRYVSLHQAHELAVRQNELYEAMLIVEQCGASEELTEAITKLGERMRHIQDDLTTAVQDVTRYD